MLQEGITVDDILSEMSEVVKNNNIKPPGWWLEEASKLNVLLGDESKKLWLMQQRVAEMKLRFRKEQIADFGKVNVSEVNLRTEATDDYRLLQEQRDKIRQVVEQIKIAKTQSRVTQEEFRGY